MDLYTNVVQGPYAPDRMAVVADKHDLTTMTRHSLIRARWKGWI